MKIRTGFVSNSSSSSFTCSVCGSLKSGFDCHSEFRCVNGHEVCENCAKKYKLKISQNKINEYEKNNDYYDPYEVPVEMCKICSEFKAIPIVEKYKFLFKEFGKSDKEIDKMIRDRFKSYSEFKNYVKEQEINWPEHEIEGER